MSSKILINWVANEMDLKTGTGGTWVYYALGVYFWKNSKSDLCISSPPPVLIWNYNILSLNTGVHRPREGLSRSLFLWHYFKTRTIIVPLVSRLRSSSLLKSKQKYLQYQRCSGGFPVCGFVGCPGCAPTWRDAMAWDKCCCVMSQSNHMVVWLHKEQLE